MQAVCERSQDLIEDISREIQQRGSAGWFSIFKSRFTQAVRTEMPADDLGKLRLFLRELSGPLAHRVKALETGPWILQKATAGKVEGVDFVDRQEIFTAESLLKRSRTALVAFRQFVFQTGRHDLKLDGAGLLELWYGSVPVKTSVRTLRRPGQLRLMEKSELISAFMEALDPLALFRKEQLKKLDEKIGKFWKDCLAAAAGGHCRLEPLKLAAGGRYVQDIEGGIPVKDSRLLCLNRHDCIFQPRVEQAE
jgi:hypothetical protein